jgi:23S rRNA (uracil1939-C5)-methyltransferase
VSRKKPLLENIEITDIGAEGKALAKADGRVIFVRGGIPGDIMDVQIIKRRRRYIEGIPLHIHKYSEMRTIPFCKHFGICGGCKWQHLEYSKQLEYKQKQVAEQFQHIGDLSVPSVNPILPAPENQYYRNKLEFTFSNRRFLLKEEIDNKGHIEQSDALGFHVTGLYDKVVNIEHCYLQKDPSNDIRNRLKSFADNEQLPFFDIRNQTGFLRNLIIRTSSLHEVMVIVSFFYDDKEQVPKVMNFLSQTFPEISSLMYVINPGGNDNITGLEPTCWKGNPYIHEKIETLTYQIGPTSFYQTNSQQVVNLYRKIKEFTELNGNEVVYDLYTGIGTIALYLADAVKKVIGIESVHEAVENARINASLNNINNAVFYTGDMKDILSPTFIRENGMPDIIILDPPRAGVHPDVIKTLSTVAPQKIIYVSCNPATQARDINMLGSQYTIFMVQPVDMFPHTHHLENITLLTKNK